MMINSRFAPSRREIVRIGDGMALATERSDRASARPCWVARQAEPLPTMTPSLRLRDLSSIL